jgi:hypothetical protein
VTIKVVILRLSEFENYLATIYTFKDPSFFPKDNIETYCILKGPSSIPVDTLAKH